MGLSIMKFPHGMEPTMNKFFDKLRESLIANKLSFVFVVKVSIEYFTSDKDLLFRVEVDLEDLVGGVLTDNIESSYLLIVCL